MSGAAHGAARPAVIGAFVVGGVALALAAVVLFGNLDLFSPKLRAAIVFQDSISGLSVGAPVTFRGVRLGAVESIAVQFDATTQTAYIPVTVQLEPKRVLVTAAEGGAPVSLQQLIARGLRAELNTQSFVTGQSEIDLQFDAASAAVLHPSITRLPEIPTRQSDLQRVREQLGQVPLRELAENANATLRSLRGLSEKLDQGLPPLIESLRATSDQSAAAIAGAGRAIAAVQLRMDATLADISRLAAAGHAVLTQRGTELHAVLLSSNQAMSQARDVLAGLQDLTAERGVSRTNLDATLRDLAAAAGALRGFALEVERNPQLLLTGRRP
ncbi:MAG: MlaD family protein [Janthinobacterium lividum]